MGTDQLIFFGSANRLYTACIFRQDPPSLKLRRGKQRHYEAKKRSVHGVLEAFSLRNNAVLAKKTAVYKRFSGLRPS